MLSKTRRPARPPASAIVVALLILISVGPARGQSVPSMMKDVKVYVSVMDPKTVADVFGRRIGNRLVAIQVTITNQNKDFQFLIHDVSLDLINIYRPGAPNLPPDLVEAIRCVNEKRKAGRVSLRAVKQECSGDRYEFSSLELSLLRGVAEKGQGQDPRNQILRMFRGVGTVAAGLIGVASFGPSYPEAVAVFNGPVISAYMDAFPDYTINQLNRLNDSAYRSNTLIPKQQAKVLVAFIPQAAFMDAKQRKLFRKDPVDLFNTQIDFRRAEALVDGSFVTEVEDLPPTASAVQIEPAELAKLQDAAPAVRGSVVGRSLTGAKIALVNSVPEGATIDVEGTPGDNRLDFVLKSPRPIPPGTPLTFEVSTTHGVQTITRPMSYTPKLPTLTGVEPDPATGAAGSDSVTITLKGTNFIPNTDVNQRATRVVPQPGSGVHVVSVDVTSATTLDVTLSISANAPRAASKLRVANPAGQSAETVTFTVSAPSNQ